MPDAEASAETWVAGPRRPKSKFGAYVAAASVGLALWIGTAAGAFLVGRSASVDPLVIAVIWINITLMLGALTVEIARRPYSLHAMHLICLFLFLGAPAILQYTRGVFAVAGPIGLYRTETVQAVFAVFLWVLTYVVVYELHQRRSRSNARGPVSGFLSREVSARRVSIILLFAILALVYLGVVVGLSGATSRAGAGKAAMEFTLSQGETLGGGLVFHLLNTLLLRAFPFVALAAGMLVLRRRRLLSQPALLGLFLISTAGVFVADNPFANTRTWLVTCLFAVVAPFLYARMRTGWAIVLTAVGGLTLLPALSANRLATNFSDWLDMLDWIGLVSPLNFLATNGDSDLLGMLVLCIRFTSIHGHQWGLQTASGLLAWFPRSLWPGKGIGTGKLVTEAAGFDFTNLAPPIVAEPMVDFGLPGVVPFACAVALLFSKLDRIYWSASHERTVPTRVIDVILPFWLGLTVLITRGDLMAAVVFTLAFTFWIVPLGVGAPRPAARREAAGIPPGGEAASGAPAGGPDAARAQGARGP